MELSTAVLLLHALINDHVVGVMRRIGVSRAVGGSRWFARGILALAVGAVLLLVGSTAANAYIYWGNADSTTIGRANNDGTGVNQSFIAATSNPQSVALDAAYIYWTSAANKTIGRANLDGTGANNSLITSPSNVYGVAVNSLGLLAQTIAFPQPSNTAINAGPIALGATASSGLTVAYTSTTPTVCSASGSQAALLSVGTCTISANQVGNGTYAHAPQVQRSFQVTAAGKLPQTQKPVSTKLRRGANVVNPSNARTMQALPQSARVSGSSFKSLATRGDVVCFLPKKGPKRKLTLQVTGQCRNLTVKVTYTAPGNNTYLPYKKTINFKYR